MTALLPHGAQTRVKSEVGSANGEVFVVGRTFEETRATRVSVGPDLAAGVEITANVAACGRVRRPLIGRAQRIRRPFLRLRRGHRGRSYPHPTKYLRVSRAIKRKVS